MSSNPHFSHCFPTQKSQSQKDQELHSHHQLKQLISTLPVTTGWGWAHRLRLYRNFWFPEPLLLGVISLRQNLHPCSPATDIFLATYPKSGTTWLKALAFAITNGTISDFSRHPLLSLHPQDCSPFLDRLFATPAVPDFSLIPPPRILGTHLPFSLLPDPVKNSNCRIVYLCREPKDTFVSMWHFLEAMGTTSSPSFEHAYDEFCRGRSAYGPVWAHQLEYWKESVERPESVMFLKYEEMKTEPERWVRRLAEFLGKPFTEEEERSGVVGKIVELCSIEKLRNLDVNREGVRGKEMDWNVKNSSFFRKGEVGDWREHLSLDMAEKLDSIMKEKFDGSGLNFEGNVMMAQGI